MIIQNKKYIFILIITTLLSLPFRAFSSEHQEFTKEIVKGIFVTYGGMRITPDLLGVDFQIQTDRSFITTFYGGQNVSILIDASSSKLDEVRRIEINGQTKNSWTDVEFVAGSTRKVTYWHRIPENYMPTKMYKTMRLKILGKIYALDNFPSYLFGS